MQREMEFLLLWNSESRGVTRAEEPSESLQVCGAADLVSELLCSGTG